MGSKLIWVGWGKYLFFLSKYFQEVTIVVADIFLGKFPAETEVTWHRVLNENGERGNCVSVHTTFFWGELK